MKNKTTLYYMQVLPHLLAIINHKATVLVAPF
jgi:hypothetical protein